MATTVTKTIGTGGDYATPQAWFDAAPSDLTTANGGTIWQGKLLNQVWSSTGTILTLSNKTVSASCYFDLGTAAGASVFDNVANPGRVDKTKGATFEVTGDSAFGIYNTLQYTRVDGVQLSGTSTGSNAAPMIRNEAANCDFNRIGAEASANNSAVMGVVYFAGASVLRNSFVLQKKASAAALIAVLVSGMKIRNVTFGSLNTTLTYGVQTQYVQQDFKNVYIGNVTAAVNDLSGGAGYPSLWTTSATSAATGATGLTANVPWSSANFKSVATDGTHDLRLAAGSALINAGSADATYAATDPYGVARPQGSAYDIGFAEYQAPAADTTPPTLSAPAASATSATSASGSVATDEAGGTLYYLFDTNATATATAIKAASSSPITATGTQNVSVTGLTAGTPYYAHFVATDAAGNTSAVANTTSFTTPAVDTTAPVFANGASITPGAITSSSLAFSYPAATDNVGVAYYETSKDGGATWQNNGTGLSGQFTGLSQNTTYPIAVRAKDAAGNASSMLSRSMTTEAAATGSFKTRPLANNTSTLWPQGTSVAWQWHSAARIGSVAASLMYGTSSVASDGTVTATGLPMGSGFLLAAIKGSTLADDKPYYQSGTAA